MADGGKAASRRVCREDAARSPLRLNQSRPNLSQAFMGGKHLMFIAADVADEQVRETGLAQLSEPLGHLAHSSVDQDRRVKASITLGDDRTYHRLGVRLIASDMN